MKRDIHEAAELHFGVSTQCPPFNHLDEDHINHVIVDDKWLRDNVSELLSIRAEIKNAQATFGVDKTRAFDRVLPALDKLYTDCVNAWRLGW